MPGDIVLSATDGVTSVGIRALTLSSVSHESLYLGNDEMVEAVGSGTCKRGVMQVLQEEASAVAFCAGVVLQRGPAFNRCRPAHDQL